MNINCEALILGNGGIGSAIADMYRSKGLQVQTLGRPQLDLTKQNNVNEAFTNLTSLPRIIINTIGMLHNESHMPEKSLREVEKSGFVY